MKKPEDMSEAYFRKHIIDPWLDEHADYWFPTTGVQCRNGIPDYCCIIKGKAVFIEAKKVGGKLSQYQKNEISKLLSKNIVALVVSPLNWDEVATRILRYLNEI